jgi:hypothetical protein
MAEDLMLKHFLDTLMRFALKTPNSLTPYTQQMADEMDELLAGVTVNDGTPESNSLTFSKELPGEFMLSR